MSAGEVNQWLRKGAKVTAILNGVAVEVARARCNFGGQIVVQPKGEKHFLATEPSSIKIQEAA